MILVDTSVWIDHLHHTNPKLRDLLHHDEIGFHPLVIEELATGSLAARDDTLRYLSYLHRFPVLSHEEFLVLVRTHALWGRGLSPVDVHLLGSVALVPGARAVGPETKDCSGRRKSWRSLISAAPPREDRYTSRTLASTRNRQAHAFLKNLAFSLHALIRTGTYRPLSRVAPCATPQSQHGLRTGHQLSCRR